MGIAARRAIQRFTWERVVDDYVDLYRELMDQDQPEPADGQQGSVKPLDDRAMESTTVS
jgi:valyl-tRNA synthetase